MATYRITINEKTKAGKNLVAFLGSLDDVVTISKVENISGIDEALTDIKKGNISKAKDANDLLRNCLT